MKLVCIGDSITWGAWDPEGGWVARLRKKVDRSCLDSSLEKFVLTYNLGISSGTSEHALGRFPAALEALDNEAHENAFVISLGTNDSARLIDKDDFWVPENEFKANMGALVDLALERSQKVLLLGSPPVDEAKTRPYSYEPNLESTNADIARYDKITEEVARAAGAAFQSVLPSFSGGDIKELLHEDGVHPNGAGHRLIAEAVWPHVETWIG